MTARPPRPSRRAEPIDLGTAELVPDPARADGWTLLIDGVEQSYVDLRDPTRLRFEYVRRLASVIDTASPRGRPLRVLHLGAGALTLPRYVAATRPRSTQLVVELDAALVALVRAALPLPGDADVRIEVGDARAAIEELADERFDVVIADVYRGAQLPAHLAGTRFAAAVARVLDPDGIYAVNLTDLPPLAVSRTHAATLRTAFAEVCLIADAALLRGRRYGNVVFAAALQPGRLPVVRLTAAAGRDPVAGRVLHGAEFDTFTVGARPVVDAG
ncbi:fused MFS/spermidine synthase [Micromonospora sp. NPDC049679]|uniref:spermidine synthase n=1 Tax=Micromonospora sp. NPDC049679 TaxID=3155920 RepID=UPI0033FDB03D